MEKETQMIKNVTKPRNFRLATFNTLNVKDRYKERECYLKEQIYRLNADMTGLQEICFGPRSLDELVISDPLAQ